MGVVIDADRRAVRQSDPRRALDLREQQIGLVLQPADFEAAAVDRAILDLGAVVIGHELAAADLAIDLRPCSAARPKPGCSRWTNRFDGPAIDRRRCRPRSASASRRRIGLVIAGDKALAFAEPRDAQAAGNAPRRTPCALAPSDSSRPLAMRQGSRSECPAPSDSAGGPLLRRDRLAAGAKRLVSREMIVLAPAGDIGPGDRRILAAGDLQRQFKRRDKADADGRWRGSGAIAGDANGARANARTSWQPATTRQRSSQRQPRQALEAARVSWRFRCQPASSSDRVRWCRGRMSRHR